ncbi:hypothetical protein GCM10011385_04970 [Nitratireductor aestuarii]|uniref:Uncharacterized protein n=1 Tax=Nitratireductor aestuarii TaxID=1735103 RepID=A0A916RFQ1_9HYPH|nr:hypothetical protein GCM10011385_04970 [Nitratireductor aestuarii]
MDARDIAGGGNDTPLAAANDQRLVDKLRIVPLLHSRIERIAIDMGDGKLTQFRMCNKARAAAGATTPSTVPQGSEAVAAKSLATELVIHLGL